MRSSKLMLGAAALLSFSLVPAFATPKGPEPTHGGAPVTHALSAQTTHGNPHTTPPTPHGGPTTTRGNPHTTTTPTTTVKSTSTSTATTSSTTGSTTTTGTTTPLNPLAQKISSHPQLATRVKAMLPSGMTLNSASDGFKNQGQFIAALHVSQNLKIPFATLKSTILGT